MQVGRNGVEHGYNHIAMGTGQLDEQQMQG